MYDIFFKGLVMNGSGEREGMTGRILNILYLVERGLLRIPVLSLGAVCRAFLNGIG